MGIKGNSSRIDGQVDAGGLRRKTRVLGAEIGKFVVDAGCFQAWRLRDSVITITKATPPLTGSGTVEPGRGALSADLP